MVTAEMTGGEFWYGAGQAAAVMLLNHIAHEVDGDGDGDADKKGKSLDDLKTKPPTHPDYKSPKGGDRKVKNPNGTGSGWIDKKGRVWVPTDHNGTHAPHWDRQNPDGTYTNVYPYQPPVVSQSIREKIGEAVGLTGTALTIYIIISEGSRLFPPRNLIPIP